MVLRHAPLFTLFLCTCLFRRTVAIPEPTAISEACSAASSSLPDCVEPYIVVCGDELECSATSTRFDIRCFACKNKFHDEIALEENTKTKCNAIRSQLPDCSEDVTKCGNDDPVCGESNRNRNCPSDDDYLVCPVITTEVDSLNSTTIFESAPSGGSTPIHNPQLVFASLMSVAILICSV